MIRRSLLLSALFIAALVSSASAPLVGFDEYAVALLHFNSGFADNAGHAFTATGGASIDATHYVFGGGSASFTTGGYISADDSPDWQLDGGASTGSWTVDLRLRFDALPETGVVWLVTQYVDAGNLWGIYWLPEVERLGFAIYEDGGQVADIARTWAPLADTWSHVAIVHHGDGDYILYVNGGGGSGNDAIAIPDLAGSLYIGGCPGCDSYAINIDELRISKDAARWTGVFTPSAYEYTAAPPLPDFLSAISYGDLGDLSILAVILILLVLAFAAWLLLELLKS